MILILCYGRSCASSPTPAQGGSIGTGQSHGANRAEESSLAEPHHAVIRGEEDLDIAITPEGLYGAMITPMQKRCEEDKTALLYIFMILQRRQRHI